jgi:hypothetical protein
MYNELEKRIKFLLTQLVHGNTTNLTEEDIGLELDSLCPDPLWSDYVFWSNDYWSDEDEDIDYDKFFKKIFSCSDE